MTHVPTPDDAPSPYVPKVGDRVVVNDFTPAKFLVAAHGTVKSIDERYVTVVMDVVDDVVIGAIRYEPRELSPETP